MDNARILYVEDDEALAFVTKDSLEDNGFIVEHCSDGREAHDLFEKESFDICIFDVMLPLLDGFELAELVREKNKEIPILFLTAKSLDEDKLTGLRIGGDDYITKPFSIEELVLKIEIFLKRKNIITPTQKDIKLGKFLFEPHNLKLINGQDESKLTQKESDLLLYLIKNKNNIARREDILKELWGENDYFLGRSMDVFISRLRKYLRDDDTLKIENIHGVGFRLSNSQEA